MKLKFGPNKIPIKISLACRMSTDISSLTKSNYNVFTTAVDLVTFVEN